MSKRTDRINVLHMLEHAREACAMARGRTRSELSSDRMLELALTRLVEIIGEAASRVSQDTRRRYPEVPWDDIIGMRHRLAHGYDAVDLDILWDTIELDLPPLIATLERLLSHL